MVSFQSTSQPTGILPDLSKFLRATTSVMVAIREIQQPSAIRFFPQLCYPPLPDPAPLVLPQPPITGLGRGLNVMRHILPATPRVQDIQNPIQHLSFLGAGPPGPTSPNLRTAPH